MEAAQLADDLKAQLELAQKKLHDFQDEIVENSVTKEKDMFNFKRAQVRAVFSLHFTCFLSSEMTHLMNESLVQCMSFPSWLKFLEWRGRVYFLHCYIPKVYRVAHHLMGMK